MSNRPFSTFDPFAGDGDSDDEVEAAAASNDPEAQRVSRLSRLIEGEIIPRLLLCHTVTRPTSTSAVAELARLMLHPEPELADAYLELLYLSGATRGMICSELLAPTARHLAELWENQACDFSELTDGLQRIEAVLHEIRGR